MKTYSQFISDILVREEWRPAKTGKMSFQAYELEKQGDPHYKVLDTAIRNLSATNTKPPKNRNIITRNMQSARLQRNIDRSHGEITRHGATSDMKNPQVQQKVISQGKQVADNAIRKKTIDTISRMQSKRTPEQQKSQAAVNRFDQTFHREDFQDLTQEKKERVKNRVGELARDIQVHAATVKQLRSKPLSNLRPNVQKQIRSNIKSAKKKQKLVQNASDALIRTSTSRSAAIQKRINDLRQQL